MPVAQTPQSRLGDFLRFRRLTGLAGTPFFLPVTSAILFVGLGDAVGGSYLTLYAVDTGHLSPLELGMFLSILALSGITISTVFARWFDLTSTLVPLFLALLMSAVGYALLPATNRFYLLLLIAGLPLGISMAAFPLLFALAKGHLDAVGDETAEGGIAMMRATWSVAWAIGPALAALIDTFFEFRGVFLTTAMCAAVAIIIIGAARVRARHGPTKMDFSLPPCRRTRRQIGLAAASLTLFHMAMFMGSIALPIVTIRDVAGTRVDVGLLFSVCAFLEVLVMFAFVLHPSTPGNRAWILAGFVAFMLCFVAAACAPSVPMLLAAQLLRAVGIGLIAYQGISYIQALMPDRVGSAAALFSNTTNAGFLFAGLAAGGWAEAFGYRSMFLACAGLSGLGLLMFHFQSRIYPDDG